MSIASLLKRATEPEPEFCKPSARPPRRAPKRKGKSAPPNALSTRRRVGRWALRGAIWFVALTVSWVLLYRIVPPPLTSLMAARYVSAGPAHRKLECDWTPYDKLSKNLVLAVIASEDQRFLDHYGFDFKDIQKAIAENEDGERLRGASTITQQAAKNCFLWPSRSWVRKGLETYFTVLIQALWGKRRTIEMYLNVAEMGPGIYGGQAAAQHYFHKDAKNLTREEAALLAAVLPNPLRYSVAKPSGYVRSRQAWILNQMNQLGGTAFLQPLGQ